MSSWPYQNTEPMIVKNLRVVVTVVRISALRGKVWGGEGVGGSTSGPYGHHSTKASSDSEKEEEGGKDDRVAEEEGVPWCRPACRQESKLAHLNFVRVRKMKIWPIALTTQKVAIFCSSSGRAIANSTPSRPSFM